MLIHFHANSFTAIILKSQIEEFGKGGRNRVLSKSVVTVEEQSTAQGHFT